MSISNCRLTPLTLNIQEVLAVIIVLVIAELGFYYGLQSTSPYFPDAMEHDDPWMVDKRQELFLAFALPLGMALFAPAVSLVRGIRQEDIRHFSRLGHFASAWPLLVSVMLWHELLIFLGCGLILIFLLVGLVAAIVVALRALLLKRNLGDLLALPLNVAWIAFCLSYLDKWESAFVW